MHSYADALRVVFICQAACNFICLLCCIPIQENPLPYVDFPSSASPLAHCSDRGSHEEQEAHYRKRQNSESSEETLV